MEEEKEAIQVLREKNRLFRNLEKEHLEMEETLQHLNRKKILTPGEEIEKKKLQKKKLAGKDSMVEIIRYYKATGRTDWGKLPMSV
ncbi:MAG TPA: hypothetical protein VI382_03880 [Candidatus Manganitrophaceae bacterium]|nr:hypothetical protein [Candidatus Manganitrophaceae bacterium]